MTVNVVATQTDEDADAAKNKGPKAAANKNVTSQKWKKDTFENTQEGEIVKAPNNKEYINDGETMRNHGKAKLDKHMQALAAVGAERDTMRDERDAMRDERDALRQEKVDQRNHKKRVAKRYREDKKEFEEDGEEGELRTFRSGKEYVLVIDENGNKEARHHGRDVIRTLLHRANNNHEASGSNDPLPAEQQP